MKPIGHEVVVEGEVYVLVDSALMAKLNPGASPCSFCSLRSPEFGCPDCIVDGLEIGVYAKRLEEVPDESGG